MFSAFATALLSVLETSPAAFFGLNATRSRAAETGKPVILHCRSRPNQRDAQDALLDELRSMGNDRPGIVIHSFSGPLDYASAMLDLGAVNLDGHIYVEVGKALAVFGLVIVSEAAGPIRLSHGGASKSLRTKTLGQSKFVLLTEVSGLAGLAITWDNVAKTATLS